MQVLSQSIKIKNLNSLEIRHLAVTNEDLASLTKNKSLNNLQSLDLRNNTLLDMEALLREDKYELESLKRIQTLLISQPN